MTNQDRGLSYSEEYKLECLERHNLAVKICSQDDHKHRVEMIVKYGNKHGVEKMEKLKEVVRLMWGLKNDNR